MNWNNINNYETIILPDIDEADALGVLLEYVNPGTSYNQETNNEFYIDKTVYNNFDDFKAKLVELKFLFGNNLRVFYTLGNSEPTSFLALINEVK